MVTKIERRRKSCSNERIDVFVRASTSDATRRAYAADLAAYRKWGGRIPTTPRQVARYLAEHADTLAYSTLVRRLAGISIAHRERGIRSPTSAELVRTTLRGIRRTYRPVQRQAAPVLQQDLRKRVKTALGLRGLRDRLLLLVGFAGAFRASELVGLNIEDVQFITAGATVHLRKSKTDQEGRGRLVVIPYGTREARSCPVRTLRAWLQRAGIETGAIFRRIDRNQKVVGERLSTQMVSLIVKKFVEKLGKDPVKFSAHSLRAGYVTSAVTAGAPSWKIRNQTGHKSDLMMQRYARTSGNLAGRGSLRLL